MTAAAATIPAGTVSRIVVTTNGVPAGRIAICVGSLTIATVKNGGDMVRNIDRALTINGFVRTTAYRPLRGLDAALATEATKVR